MLCYYTPVLELKQPHRILPKLKPPVVNPSLKGAKDGAMKRRRPRYGMKMPRQFIEMVK